MQSNQVNEPHTTHVHQKSLTLISGLNLDHQTTSQVHQESYISHTHHRSAILAGQSNMDFKTVSSLQSNQGITGGTRRRSMRTFQELAIESTPPSQFFPPTDLPQTLNGRIASHINSVQNNFNTTPSSHITTTSAIQQRLICMEDKGTAFMPSFTEGSLSSSTSTLPDPSQISIMHGSDETGSQPLPQSGVDPSQKPKIPTALDHNSGSDSELSDVDIDSGFADIEIRLTAASTQLEQSACSDGSIRRVSTRPRTTPRRLIEEIAVQKQTSNSKVSAQQISPARNRSSLPIPSPSRSPSPIVVSVASLSKLTMLTFIIDFPAQISKQRIIQTSTTSH